MANTFGDSIAVAMNSRSYFKLTNDSDVELLQVILCICVNIISWNVEGQIYTTMIYSCLVLVVICTSTKDINNSCKKIYFFLCCSDIFDPLSRGQQLVCKAWLQEWGKCVGLNADHQDPNPRGPISKGIPIIQIGVPFYLHNENSSGDKAGEMCWSEVCFNVATLK